LYSQDRLDPLHRPGHLLCVPILTVGLTILGIAAIAIICAYTIPPTQLGPDFAAHFTAFQKDFYLEQPAKTTAYEISCLATPLLLAVSFWWARRWVRSLSDETVARLNRIGTAVFLLFVVWCALPMFYCPNPPFAYLPPSWLLLPVNFSGQFWTPIRALFLILAGGSGFYFVTSPASRRNANRALILLLAIWAVLVPSRFYVPDEIDDNMRYTYHLNSMFDAMSQSINGHHLLVDFPHIYGGYGEILAPVIRLFARSIDVLIAALALPNVLGVLCLLLTARLVIRSPALLCVTGLALLGTEYAVANGDLYYNYNAARFFLPPVGLLAATLYFRHSGARWYATATVIAAIAPIWNLDTGLILWVSWLGTLLAGALGRWDWSATVRHLLAQISALAAAWIAFFLYLRFASGQWPDAGLLFYFQSLFAGDGYFCLRLIVPDMWTFILTIYLIGLAVVLSAYVRRKASWLTPATLMITLIGIGIFSYFLGRSVESNLVVVAYPAVLLAGILCAEAESLVRKGKLPAVATYILLPSKFALFWWAFLFVAALPTLMASSERVVTRWRNPTQTPVMANAAFVEQQVQPQEQGVFFLSNHSGIYYYLSDTTRPLKIPGMAELFRVRDMNVLIDAIRSRRIKKLFVDQNFYDIGYYRPEFYHELHDATAQNYQQTAMAPTRRLFLYTPR